MTNEQKIIENLVLVHLRISFNRGRIRCKQVEDDAVEKHDSKQGAVSGFLNMFPKRFTSPVTTQLSRLRVDFYEECLPWDKYWYVVPAAKWNDLLTMVSDYREKAHEALSAVVSQYDEFRKATEEKVGNLWDPTAFPSKAELATSLEIDLIPSSVADPDDIRLTGLTEIARKQIKEDMEQRYEEQFSMGAQTLIDRMQEMIASFIEKLSVEEQKGLKYSKTLERIKKTCNSVRSLNIFKNADIAAACDRIENDLGQWDQKVLKESSFVRDHVKAEGATILEQLKGIRL